MADLLLELLARVHGDGGHHTAKVGLAQSCADADARISSLLTAGAERDELRAQLALLSFRLGRAEGALEGLALQLQAIRPTSGPEQLARLQALADTQISLLKQREPPGTP